MLYHLIPDSLALRCMPTACLLLRRLGLPLVPLAALQLARPVAHILPVHLFQHLWRGGARGAVARVAGWCDGAVVRAARGTRGVARQPFSDIQTLFHTCRVD